MTEAASTALQAPGGKNAAPPRAIRVESLGVICLRSKTHGVGSWIGELMTTDQSAHLGLSGEPMRCNLWLTNRSWSSRSGPFRGGISTSIWCAFPLTRVGSLRYTAGESATLRGPHLFGGSREQRALKVLSNL